MLLKKIILIIAAAPLNIHVVQHPASGKHFGGKTVRVQNAFLYNKHNNEQAGRVATGYGQVCKGTRKAY